MSALCFRVGDSLKNLASHPGATLAIAGGDTLSHWKTEGRGFEDAWIPHQKSEIRFFQRVARVIVTAKAGPEAEYFRAGRPIQMRFSGRTPHSIEDISGRTPQGKKPKSRRPGKKPRGWPKQAWIWFVCAKAGLQARNTAPFPHYTGAKAGQRPFTW